MSLFGIIVVIITAGSEKRRFKGLVTPPHPPLRSLFSLTEEEEEEEEDVEKTRRAMKRAAQSAGEKPWRAALPPCKFNATCTLAVRDVTR